MAKLGVNIDHVATVRQARKTYEPDPVWAAVEAELGGADQITVHLREDRRHIQDRDVELLIRTVQTRVNLELAVAEEVVKIALKLKPQCACLVPEKREEVTTEGGLDVAGSFKVVEKTVKKLSNSGIVVSLFIDPDPRQITASAKAGAQYVELHTGAYAQAKTEKAVSERLAQLHAAARTAASLGLRVNAGHGLNYRNVSAVAGIGEIEEFNIGHAIVARALFVGLREAVREMKGLIK